MRTERFDATAGKETTGLKEPIRKITMADGSVRYRLVVDIGQGPRGNRKQITRTFDKLKEARTELSKRASDPE